MRNVIFREARSEDELLGLLKVRHEAYKGSDLSSVEPSNDLGFTLDRYDFQARHFGLFADGTPLACIRVVDNAPFDLNPASVGLASRYPAAICPKKTDDPLPVMTYWPERETLVQAYANLGDDARICEASRLSVAPGWRTLRLAISLTHCSVAAYFFARRYDAALVACRTGHARFYSCAGFRQLAGTSDARPDGFPLLRCLVSRPEWVPQEMADRCRTLAEELSTRGEIVLAASVSAAA